MYVDILWPHVNSFLDFCNGTIKAFLKYLVSLVVTKIYAIQLHDNFWIFKV